MYFIYIVKFFWRFINIPRRAMRTMRIANKYFSSATVAHNEVLLRSALLLLTDYKHTQHVFFNTPPPPRKLYAFPCTRISHRVQSLDATAFASVSLSLLGLLATFPHEQSEKLKLSFVYADTHTHRQTDSGTHLCVRR